ncbi:hypothetical protein KSS87_013890 [Heliosperma pusillum]|nr:hypothetical protein KSS87_013890 [Heliosperma pusillum]
MFPATETIKKPSMGSTSHSCYFPSFAFILTHCLRSYELLPSF